MKLHIAIPTHSGTVAAETVQSLFDDLESVRAAGWEISLRILVRNAWISHARNRIVADFCASDADRLLFVDADVGWEPDGVARLLKHDEDFVAGVYPTRVEPVRWPVIRKRDCTGLDERGLLEVAAVPAGFLSLSRKCLLQMQERFASMSYADGEGSERSVVDLFGHGLAGGGWWGEDYMFCGRWIGMGGKIWVDPSIGMIHVGTKAFVGRFSEALGA